MKIAESGGGKPRYRGLRDIERPRHIGLPLVRRERSWPSESHSPRLGTRSAIASAGTNQLSLELSQATEHCEHQPPVRRCGICPCVPETAEAGFPIADGGHDIEQIAG